MSVDHASGRHGRPPWTGEPPPPSAAPQLYAGLVMRRCLAYLVDLLVIAALGLCLGFALSVIGVLSFGLLSPLAVVTMALWPILYQSFFLIIRGATPGMRLFDLELRDWSGKKAEPFQAVLVVILFYVTIWITAWLILLVIPFTERNRALHDILAGTLVVRRHG
jgi:uncharacterized RDD family membrane protein YckC